MSEFERYKVLLRRLQYRYKGIELSHVYACQIWAEANGINTFSIICLANFFLAQKVSKLKLPLENGIFSTFMDTQRKDHYDLYCSVIRRMSVQPSVNELFNIKKKLSIHPLIIYRVLGSVFNKALPFKKKIIWAAKYTFLCNTINELDKIDFSKVNKYISMCHVLEMENLYTQYFRKRGIPTYSLQEGIYLVYKKNIVLGSIAYDLFATDHLLCWGQYTKDEYVKFGIDPNRIRVAGYPKCNTMAQLKPNNPYKSILVLLAGPIFGDVNLKLLQLLERQKSDFDITLKSHPSNYEEMENYAKRNGFNIISKAQTVNDCLTSGNFDFCIAVNTTAYYESWMAGIPCIRYYDERFDNFYGFNDLFSDDAEFISMIENYRKNPQTEIEVKEMMEYAIGFGLDNYDTIINEN